MQHLHPSSSIRTFIPCFLFLGLALLLSLGQAAESVPVPSGRYTLDPSSLRSMEEALTKAASQFGGMQRQLAFKRLRERMVPPGEVELASSDAGVALRLGDNRFPVMQLGGTPLPWNTKEGKDARVSLRREGPALIHEIANGERTRRNLLTFDATKKVLRMEVQIHGPQLRHPLTYTLRYLPTP